MKKGSVNSLLWPLGALVFAVAAASSQIVWIIADKGGMVHSDSFSMLTRTIQFYNDHQLWDLGFLSIAGRPPVYQLMSMPALMVGGGTEDAAQISNILYFLVMALGVYLLTSRISKSRSIGAIAVVLICSYPPIIHMSSIFRPHAAFPALATLLMLGITSFTQSFSARSVWALAAVLTVGLLTHPAFAFYSLAPVTLAAAIFLRASPQSIPAGKKRTLFHLFVGAAAAFALLAIWYTTAGEQILRDFLFWKGPEAQEFREARYRSGFENITGDNLWYLKTAPHVLSWPFVLLTIFGLAMMSLRLSRERAMLMIFVAGGLTFQAILDNGLHWYRLAAVLPAVAVISALGIAAIEHQRLRQVVCCLTAAIAIFIQYLVLWGTPDRPNTIGTLLGVPSATETCTKQARRAFSLCPKPPIQSAFDERLLIEEIQNVTSCGNECEVMIVQRGPLNAVAMKLAIQQEGIDGIRVFGIGSNRWGGQLRLAKLLTADIVLFIPGATDDATYSSRATRFLTNQPAIFRQSHQSTSYVHGELPEIVILERIGELTSAEFNEAREALLGQDRLDGESVRLASQLYRREGQYESAISVLDALDSLKERDLIMKARIELDLQDPSKAIETLTTAIREFPNSASARIFLGRVYLQNARHREAVDVLQWAADRRPNDRRLHQLLDRAKSKIDPQ